MGIQSRAVCGITHAVSRNGKNRPKAPNENVSLRFASGNWVPPVRHPMRPRTRLRPTWVKQTALRCVYKPSSSNYFETEGLKIFEAGVIAGNNSVSAIELLATK